MGRMVVLIALAAQAGMAYFNSGYKDFVCRVNQSIEQSNRESHSTHTDYLKVTYTYACPNGVNYSTTLYQAREAVDISMGNTSVPIGTVTTANPCLPGNWIEPVELGGVIYPPRYDEAGKKVVIRSSHTGLETSCADATLKIADGKLVTVPFPTKASLVTWSTPSQSFAANAQGALYDANRYSISFPYGTTILPAKPFEQINGVWGDQDAAIADMRWFAKVSFAGDSRYFATVSVLPGFNNGDLFDKPILVGDAFDPTNERNATTISTTVRYANLLNRNGPRGRGYDMYFLDFSQGGGDIYINAGLQLKFLEWLSTRAKDKILVGGPSMSGVVSRLALLYSLPRNNVQKADYGTKVKGFLSIDAPMQGASASYHLQQRMYELKDMLIVMAGEFLSGSNKPEDSWKQLSTPAAHQMLYEHYYPDGSDMKSSHAAFYGQLKAMGGYRNDIPLASIAYSNFYRNTYPGNDVQIIGAIIDPPGLSERAVYVRNHELVAGSSADWYWNSYRAKSHDYMYLQNYGSPLERFKGTFIPIRSALDLPADYGPNGVPANYVLAAQTPFQHVYFMASEYNGYCNTSGACSRMDEPNRRATIEDRRYLHLVFDMQLMNTIATALAGLETASLARSAVPAIAAACLR